MWALFGCAEQGRTLTNGPVEIDAKGVVIHGSPIHLNASRCVRAVCYFRFVTTQRSRTNTTTTVSENDFPVTGWQRAPAVEAATRQAGLVVEAWMVTSGDGRRWLVTCGTGTRGETYVNATLKLGVGHRYLPQDVAARMLEAARRCAN